METRYSFIERMRRLVYGGQPSDDASISFGLVGKYVDDALAAAAKQNYKDNLGLEGVAFVNNSFYTTFKNISIISDGNFRWKLSLPQIPVGIGSTTGISTLELNDSNGLESFPCFPLSETQKGYYKSLPPIPNSTLFYYEGNIIFIISTILLNIYTARVSMISGGDSTDMNSIMNVPSDYIPFMINYIRTQLMEERAVEPDTVNDGQDLGTNKN